MGIRYLRIDDDDLSANDVRDALLQVTTPQRFAVVTEDVRLLVRALRHLRDDRPERGQELPVVAQASAKFVAMAAEVEAQEETAEARVARLREMRQRGIELTAGSVDWLLSHVADQAGDIRRMAEDMEGIAARVAELEAERDARGDGGILPRL